MNYMTQPTAILIQRRSMKLLKVMTVVGTRPEIIRLSRVISKLETSTEHVLVHTGQNYDFELNEVFFKDLRLKNPKHYLEAVGNSAIDTIGRTLSKIDPILEKESPDAFLVLGDTNSCLTALAAKRKKIPVFHMEAGNRCFDENVPEEINRRVIDHVSDINLPYSSIARQYLINEGVPPDRIIKTGSPMYEVIHFHLPDIKASNVLNSLGLKEKEYFVLSCHREENIEMERNFKNLVESVSAIAQKYEKPILFSVHPRTRKKIEAAGVHFPKQVILSKPLGFTDYVRLQMSAFMVLSDSGTITEESSILNFPALNIREAHERPEGMEEAAVVLTGLNPERVLQSIELIKGQSRDTERTFRLVEDYSQPNVSEKVTRIIFSYVDYIRKRVWNNENPLNRL